MTEHQTVAAMKIGNAAMNKSIPASDAALASALKFSPRLINLVLIKFTES